MPSVVTFEEQLVRLMTHYKPITRDTKRDEWVNASLRIDQWVVHRLLKWMGSQAETTPERFFDRLPEWCRRIEETKASFDALYRGLVKGTTLTRTAFNTHGGALSLEADRLQTIFTVDGEKDIRADDSRLKQTGFYRIWEGLLAGIIKCFEGIGKSLGLIGSAADDETALSQTGYKTRWNLLSAISPGTSTNVEVLEDVKDAGLSYKRLGALRGYTKRDTPLAALGELMRAASSEDNLLVEWVQAVDAALKRDGAKLPFSLLHKVLVDVVAHTDVPDRGRALGQLYQKLQTMGLDVTAQRDTEQEAWVRELESAQTKSVTIPGTEGSTGKGKEKQRGDDFVMVDRPERTLQLGNEIHEGKSDEKAYATTANDAGPVRFNRENPAKLLVRVAQMPVRHVQYIDPLGRFAISTPRGKQAVSGTADNQAEFRSAIVTLVKTLLWDGERAKITQPKGFKPVQHIRLVGGEVEVRPPEQGEEPIDIAALESFLWELAQNQWPVSPLAPYRSCLEDTRLGQHPRATSLRTELIKENGGQLKGKIQQAAQRLKEEYQGTRDDEQLIRQGLSEVLQALGVIRVIPSDLAEYLVTHVATKYSLEKKKGG